MGEPDLLQQFKQDNGVVHLFLFALVVLQK
jgi:hypothetical protein